MNHNLPDKAASLRKIIHVDMDAFYASVEQRDNPRLAGLPVVVGGMSGRGVVCAASYEARKYGVRSAMPSSMAQKLCPQAIFRPPRFDVYKQVSSEVMEIFAEYTDAVEALSLDEAYLDVTTNKKGQEFATDIAKEIIQTIYDRTNLTASAGVAPNKFLAKLASDMQKPKGLVVISPNRVERILEALPVEKLPGVGKVTQERMRDASIFTTKDIRERSLEEMTKLLGKSGAWFYEISHGRDDRPVSSYRERKSVGVEDTFFEDVLDTKILLAKLDDLISTMLVRLKGKVGRTLTVKLTYKDFKKITRSKTFDHRTDNQELIREAARELFEQTEAGEVPVRLVGVSLSGFTDKVETEVRPKRHIPIEVSPLQISLFG